MYIIIKNFKDEEENLIFEYQNKQENGVTLVGFKFAFPFLTKTFLSGNPVNTT